MDLDRTPVGELVLEHRDEILDLVRRHHGRSVSVFGSVASGDATAQSDVDLLVDFEPGSSLLDVVRLEDALAAVLGRPVDVVSAGALLDRDEEIRRQAVPL
ncbi:MAG TPA: nucleotidyltransferase domain-containing protein [Acidimicrobiales bacterium]|nr:nucleotidyltransferase domain-containing protein [Acidimicrobiales bacterium]